MNIAVEYYWPIVLLVLIPIVWWVQRRSFTGFTAQQRVLQTVVRSAVLLLLIFALMQPTWERSGRWLSVVYLLDQSASVSPASAVTASQWISASTLEGQPDHWQAMTFGASTVALDNLEALKWRSVGMLIPRYRHCRRMQGARILSWQCARQHEHLRRTKSNASS